MAKMPLLHKAETNPNKSEETMDKVLNVPMLAKTMLEDQILVACSLGMAVIFPLGSR